MKSFAFVFPGQGSQAVGMLDAWGDHPAVRETLRRSVRRRSARTSAALIREGPKEALDLTTNTQPVMLAAGIACYRAWLRRRRRRAGRAWPATRWANTRALVAAGVADARRRAAAGALSRPGDAGGGAGGRRRDGGDPRPRRRKR